MDGEWKQYKDAFARVAEDLCGRTSGERRYIEKQKPRMVDERGGETTLRLKAPGQKKAANL